MVACMVQYVTHLIFTTGGTELVLQDLLDSIIPGLLPLVCTLGLYKLIKKNVSTNMH
ncbi:PTS system mannose/fructose/sorbose family transporter subunit IID [Enterococcus faecium]|uniref:PTS system mannose/fructose/sorbose family transporter subunit IID n=1 Tax=Enterococcus faecium TaxID=1352 RepID=UPI003CC621F1